MIQRFRLPLLLLLAACCAWHVTAQDASSGNPISQEDWSMAPNRWQLTPANIRTQMDTVSPTVRAKRNAYWKAPLEAFYNTPKGGRAVVSGGSFIRNLPELRNVDGSVWVLATFQSFHIFAIDEEFKLVYTEINFRIDTIISQPDTTGISENAVMDVGIPGGMLRTSSGQVISSRVEKQQYAFQLGHRYLLQLTKDPQLAGEFTVNKRWDITSGYARPDTPDEVDRADHGQSSIAGLSVPALLDFLKRQLPNAEGIR